METSTFFKRTLFHETSPTAGEYFERCSGSIFEKDPSKACLEVRYQPCYDRSKLHERIQLQSQLSRSEKLLTESEDYLEIHKAVASEHQKSLSLGLTGCKGFNSREESYVISDSDDSHSMMSDASSTALPVGLDQRQGDHIPPMYPGPPRLVNEMVDLDKLEDFVHRTRAQFRVFYLRQRHSYSRVQITRSLFEQLTRSCHVFPRFSEYMVGFGSKRNDYEVGPPPLKYKSLCAAENSGYRGFECSYILRYVEFTDRPGKKPWSLRQFVTYHRYKLGEQNPCSTWILVGASQRTERQLDQYTRSIEDMLRANPFELHVMFLDSAIESWRPYLIHLTELVTEQSHKAVGTTIRNGTGQHLVTIDVEDHQDLKQLEDDISDLILCLESTSDSITTLVEMHSQFVSHQACEAKSNILVRDLDTGDAILDALHEKTKSILYSRKKAEALLSKVQNTRKLISSLLERKTGHDINQQMIALEQLSRQHQDENILMRQLAEKGSRDSSSMRILTIITMVYLPCTIVSNFFSTQFVTAKEYDNGDSKLEYTNNAWLFFAISVPLTLFTILVWYVWINLESVLKFLLQAKGKSWKTSSKPDSLPVAEKMRPTLA